ncbi:hypothetical protein [Thiomicrospira microaerophila]|uniref:hypothetical protein n=1 Tax=Thiomicrospira microaerophila TaxID=406020 RepID=UPI0005C86147|nr:hypothetical protein [Thiomicrospira microaerophila]
MKPLIFALLFISWMPAVSAFSFEDLDRLQQFEQENLLELAKKEARSWNFRRAEAYLEQAKNKAYNPTALAEARAVYNQQQNAYHEEQRRQEQERLRHEEERRLAEQRRHENARSSASTSRSSNASPRRFTCSITCRTSGFLLYDTRQIGPVTITAVDPNFETREMSRICNSTLSGQWYHDKHKCQ